MRQVTGRYLSQSQGRDAVTAGEGVLYLASDPRGPSLEDTLPEVFADLSRYGDLCRTQLREEMQVEFTLETGRLCILDAVRVQRSSRAEVRIAVALAEDGIIPKEEAILRVAPRAMSELLHRQVDPRGTRDICARGIAASPGAATGRVVFTSRAAQAAASREEPCILVRRETTPEDIRGMHAAVGVLTERGGMSSHAAVIARGLGLPAVVGASGLRLSRRDRTMTTDDGRVFREGDIVTLDGSTGQVLAGRRRSWNRRSTTSSARSSAGPRK
jgi:pyruvate, orthophosphate dikinase